MFWRKFCDEKIIIGIHHSHFNKNSIFSNYHRHRWQWYLLIYWLPKHHLNNLVIVTCIFSLWSCANTVNVNGHLKSIKIISSCFWRLFCDEKTIFIVYWSHFNRKMSIFSNYHCQWWQWYLLFYWLCKHYLNNQVNVTCIFALWTYRKLYICNGYLKLIKNNLILLLKIILWWKNYFYSLLQSFQ
jgi:hypothetical protein